MNNPYLVCSDRELRILPTQWLRAERWEKVGSLLYDFEFVNEKVGRLGIDELLQDFLQTLQLLEYDDWHHKLVTIKKVLDLESHNLRDWQPNEQPGYLAQQIYNRAESNDQVEWKRQLLKFFQKNKLSWLCERFQSPHESSSLLRTITGIRTSGTILKITPSGMIVSVSVNDNIKMWDLASGQEMREFSERQKFYSTNPFAYYISDIDISADSRLLVSTYPNNINVWDISSGQKINTFSVNKKHVAITPNDRMIIAISDLKDPNDINVLDINNGRKLPLSCESGLDAEALRVDYFQLDSLLVTPDSRFAIIAKVGLSGVTIGYAVRINLTNGKVRILRDCGGCVALTPDGSMAISFHNKKIKIWDIESGKVIRTFKGQDKDVSHVAITQNGLIAISVCNKSLSVWNIESGKLLHTLEGHDDVITDIAITPDSCRVISASQDTSLKVWDLVSGQELQTLLGHSKSVNKVIVSPDGSLIVSMSKDGTLKVWDLSFHSVTRTNTSRHSGLVCSVTISPNNKFALSASIDKNIKVWDLTNGKELRIYSDRFSETTSAGNNSMVNGIAISPDSRLAISILNSTLKVWNIDNGKKKRTISEFFLSNFSVFLGVAITPDGQSVISTSNDDTLKIWNITNGKKLQTMRHALKRDYGIQSVALTPDGSLIITACGKDLHIWDFATGQKIRTLSKHTETVSALAISSDSKLVISASKDKTLKVWNIASGQVLKNLVGHNDVVWSVAIKPNGYLAASVSEDKTLRIWNIVNGKELLTFPSETPLFSVAIAPDGNRLITGDNVGSVRFFDIVNS